MITRVAQAEPDSPSSPGGEANRCCRYERQKWPLQSLIMVRPKRGAISRLTTVPVSLITSLILQRVADALGRRNTPAASRFSIQSNLLDTPSNSFYTTNINMSSSFSSCQAKNSGEEKVRSVLSADGARTPPERSVLVGQPPRPAVWALPAHWVGLFASLRCPATREARSDRLARAEPTPTWTVR